jgi:hypothetical protein
MSEPVPNPTPAPAPAPSPAPAPAPSAVAPEPSPSPAPAPAASPRPEPLPESFWDGEKGTIKLDEFVPHYAEIANFHKTETEKRAALAARKPEDIKIEVKLPDSVTLPDGMSFKIDEKDPRVPLLRAIAQQRGLDQDTVNDLVAFDAQQQLQAHNAELQRVVAEEAKLGANAKDRKAAVKNWLTGLKTNGKLNAEEAAAVEVYATDAATVTALEKIMAMAAGAVPGNVNAETPPNSPQPKSLAERMYPNLPSQRAS